MSLYLSEIVSISGKPGLYKLIGKRANGLIVESLNGDQKRFPTSLTQKVSFLSDISMYTYDGDLGLADIFKELHVQVESGLPLVNKKSSADEIDAFFRQVLKDYDEDQVYKSDIIKLVNWYTLLKTLLDFDQLIAPDADTAKKETKSASPNTPKKNIPKNAAKAQNKAKGGVKKSGNLKAG